MEPEDRTRIFLSYNTLIEHFVAKVAHCLERQARVATYFAPEQPTAGDLSDHIKQEIESSQKFVLLISDGTATSTWQDMELCHWQQQEASRSTGALVPVYIGDAQPSPQMKRSVKGLLYDRYDSADREFAPKCAERLLDRLRLPFAPYDGLPRCINAKYEKDIINLYLGGGGRVDFKHVRNGYPESWPSVTRYDASVEDLRSDDNPLEEDKYGSHRPDPAAILVDARALHLDPRDAAGEAGSSEGDGERRTVTPANGPTPLTFPEAGPRPEIVLPNNQGVLRVGILISGGIAPGINAVVTAIIERHQTYAEEYRRSSGLRHSLQFVGCIEGLKGLRERSWRYLSDDDIHRIRRSTSAGGSWLPTARADELLTDDPEKRADLLREIAREIAGERIDVLYVVGGEGSMRAAHAICSVFARERQRRLRVVGVPKTMDNDILWVWQSFGFQSAVEKAKQEILHVSAEVMSNPRVGIVQLFGSASGFVCSHAAFASNVCDLVLIPEMRFTMREVCSYLDQRLTERRQRATNPWAHEGVRSPYALVVMAETAMPTDFEDFLNADFVGLTDDHDGKMGEKSALLRFGRDDFNLIGQTPDELRSGSLKIVSRVVQRYLQEAMGTGNMEALGGARPIERGAAPDPYWKSFRVVTNEPRHLIRSVEPSAIDIAYGARLGTMAVDTAMAGFTDCMVSQWLTEYVVVPLELVVLGRKRLPRDGIFWRTVVAQTTQMESHPSLT